MKNIFKYLVITTCMAIAPLSVPIDLPIDISNVLEQDQALSPKITINLPANGEIYALADNPVLDFSVENFTFVDFKGNTEPFPGNPNAGQARLWIDPPTFLQLENSQKILSTEEISLANLGPGRHRIVMELVQNNLESYNPPVRAEVKFRFVTPREWGMRSIILAIIGFIAVMAGAAYLFYKFLWKREN